VLVGGPLFGWVHGRRLALDAPALGLDVTLGGYVLVYATAALLLGVGSVAYALLDRGRGKG
jgi:hypothetical protein